MHPATNWTLHHRHADKCRLSAGVFHSLKSHVIMVGFFLDSAHVLTYYCFWSDLGEIFSIIHRWSIATCIIICISPAAIWGSSQKTLSKFSIMPPSRKYLKFIFLPRIRMAFCCLKSEVSGWWLSFFAGIKRSPKITHTFSEMRWTVILLLVFSIIWSQTGYRALQQLRCAIP